MLRLLMAFLFCLASCLANAQEIDWRMVKLEWHLIKQQLGAPEDLLMPPVIVSAQMPAAARMMFQYPTEENPNDRMIIMINPTTLENYDREMISWGLGHELTHYAMILKENSWDTQRKIYTQTIRHHCNPTFMNITKQVADIITSVYHDESARYRMYHQVQRSCVDQPNQ